MPHRLLLFVLSSVLIALGMFPSQLRADSRPNIVVIMADDLGYSDLGCYGSEIETPNLDALAGGGLRFSQFYNTAKCHSSRVSLLTGQYCLAAGDTALDHAVTSAETLADAGYFTAMTGKWHLDREPTDFGFGRYFGHLSGACNFFYGDNTFRLNGQPWTVPRSGFYTTVANVDFAIDFLSESRQKSEPFYLYVAFNAPHEPLHALPEDYAKYKGRYDAGWEAIRKGRIAKQKTLGLLPKDLTPSPRPDHVRAWGKLVPWQRDYEINRMVTLAAMIDRLDQEVGRLVDNLKQNGELDNTLILFVSDNGACPYDRRAPVLSVEPTNGDVSFPDSTGWAWARNAPFRFYKQNQFEGGISTPGIVHWPAGLKTQAGSIVDTPVHLVDVLPTLADFASAEIPNSFAGREVRPVSGVSLRPIFEGGDLERKEPIHLQFANDYGLRDGDWKLVSFRGQSWELYNVAEDRTELNNLAQSEPERLASMVKKWREMTRSVLKAPQIADRKIQPARASKRHPDWTIYSDTGELPARWAGKKQPRKKTNSWSIRARKNTVIARQPGKLVLKFSGDDPGIAMDFRNAPALPPGPYRLSFDLKTNTKGTGEVFYTNDAKTSLPNGVELNFLTEGTTEAQHVGVAIDSAKPLKQLRLDVCEGSGEATLENLQLRTQDGTLIHDWTKP